MKTSIWKSYTTGQDVGLKFRQTATGSMAGCALTSPKLENLKKTFKKQKKLKMSKKNEVMLAKCR